MNIQGMVAKTVGTAMLAGALMLAPQAAQARVFVSVGIAPPLIPAYDQPLCPGDGYIWTPGYWAYGDNGYYWIDGAWVMAPYVGALWTPGYWGWGGGGYLWNAGYWGRNVGYYGGINYGFGYFGTGFYGGYWGGGHYFYNRGYNHINFNNIHNVYNSPYRGGSVRPGGSSFTRSNVNYGGNRGSSFNGRDGNFNRGGNFNGRDGNFNRGSQNFAGNQNRSNYGGFGNRDVNSNARQNFNARAYSGNQGSSQPRSFAQSNGNAGRSFSSAQSAPRSSGGGNFGGGGQRGFNGGGGGGGGFHGGGGGGGSRGGGGGGHR